LPLVQFESSNSSSRQFAGGSSVPLKYLQLEICQALLGWIYTVAACTSQETAMRRNTAARGRKVFIIGLPGSWSLW
jgi:hypothetical protein